MTNTDNSKKGGRHSIFFREFGGNGICLICKEKVAVLKEYNLKRHYTTKHGEQYDKYSGDCREVLKMCAKLESFFVLL